MNSINDFDIQNIANNETLEKTNNPTSKCGSPIPFASWTKYELILNNGVVKKIIKLPSPTGNFLTTSYQPVVGEFKYFEPQNTDFQFGVNGLPYSGQNNWSLIEIKSITDTLDGDGASVTLLSLDKKIQVILKFLLYPNLPVIRKNLVIKNLANEEISLESIDVEKFNINHYFAPTFSWIYSDYGS